VDTTDQPRRYRLLIVDDDEADRRHYSRLLARRAPGTCEIRHAASGAAGLAALRAQTPDCVLLDFDLPDMTGLQFLANAAAEAFDNADDSVLPCAIVLVTGHGTEAIAVAAMKRGALDYLVKGQVNENSLWQAMTRAVSQKELRQLLAGSLRALTAANAALAQEVAVRTATEADLRRAKDIAEQDSQAKTRFVTMVTHELRTPLNGILGYTQLLRIEGDLTARQDAHVEAMTQAARHLLAMIEHVLDFAALEADRVELHPMPVAVQELAEECLAVIRPMAALNGLDVRLVGADTAPQQIIVDPARLRQVLLNLLGNAVKFTQEGRVELRLLAGAAPGALRIEVADTGPGIREAVRDRLFRDFERLDAPVSAEGAGLGLAITARSIGLMGGAIGHSDNPGGGSLFWVELPGRVGVDETRAADWTEIRASQRTDTVSAAPSSTGRQVLLVDDIAMNRDVVGAFLHTAGHEVTEADSGAEALRLAGERHFDLILMDVRMPGMDGLAATRRIRALPAPYCRVPIVALTAHAFRDQVEQCREAGMDGHLAKPVDYATLVRVVDETIAGGGPDRAAVRLAPHRGPVSSGASADYLVGCS
jgi:signal transduction histidine kinase